MFYFAMKKYTYNKMVICNFGILVSSAKEKWHYSQIKFHAVVEILQFLVA